MHVNTTHARNAERRAALGGDVGEQMHLQNIFLPVAAETLVVVRHPQQVKAWILGEVLDFSDEDVSVIVFEEMDGNFIRPSDKYADLVIVGRLEVLLTDIKLTMQNKVRKSDLSKLNKRLGLQ